MGGWYNKEINNLADFQGKNENFAVVVKCNRLGGISVNMSVEK